MARKPSVVTLLTDFGTADYFVGAMKGVILGINPSVQVVDITHEIPAQDIEAGAFTLLNSYGSFPPGTVHVAVVDPGVGSRRRALVVRAAKQFFVGPDNGLFSYVMDRHPTSQAFQLTADKYFRHPVSQTFQGRDVFAPVAAALSNGVELLKLGKKIKEPVRLTKLAPSPLDDGRIEGRVLHIDHFGNCITNFLPEHLIKTEVVLLVNGKRIKSFRRFYADSNEKEELFAIWGSAGFLEIAAQNRSAAAILKIQRGTRVVLEKKR